MFNLKILQIFAPCSFSLHAVIFAIMRLYLHLRDIENFLDMLPDIESVIIKL